MLDIGWSELMVIGVVALIVIGPKELPEMFRTLGRFTAKARSMARDFQRAMEQAANETGVKDVASDLKSVASPSSMGLTAVKKAADKFEKWDPLKPQPKPAAAAPVPDPEAPAPAAMGPATKALADKMAEDKAARQAAFESSLAPKPDPAAPAAPPVAVPAENAAPAAQRKPVTRKPKAAPTTAPEAAPAKATKAKAEAKATSAAESTAVKKTRAPKSPAGKGPDLLGAAVDKSTAAKARKSGKAAKTDDSGSNA